jgi:formylglycine-generating enzyme required for sulfatase activity
MAKLYFTVLMMLSFISSFGQQGDSHKLDSLLIEGYAVEFILVKGGSFIMGSNNLDEELPAHSVSVSSFYLSKYEITQRLWNLVMGSNDSYHANCDDCPVDNVSWNDVQQFINKLNIATGKR